MLLFGLEVKVKEGEIAMIMIVAYVIISTYIY